jgi:spermidine synthase
MGKLFSKQTYTSEKNGVITVNKVFGIVSIVVNGCGQYSDFLTSAWRRLLRQLPTTLKPERILMLGLAGGNVVKAIYDKYPQAKLTIIEWDPVMVQITRDFKLVPFDDRIQIKIGDALQVISKINKTFDLIVIDIFHGPEPDPRLSERATISQLLKLLNSTGYILINVYTKQAIISAFERYMRKIQSWTFTTSHFALLQKIPENKIS